MWQAANMSLADGWMLTQGAIEALEAHGSAEQKAIYLPKLVTGEWSGTMNLTESGAGSDVGALRTKAEPDNGSWRITGTKIFITHGDQDMSDNVIHLVLARTPGAPPGTKGISLFLVPKRLVDDDGRLGPHNDLRVVSLEHKLGHLASPTAMMSYGDDGGALGGLIGGENQGMACMFTMMNNARLNVAVQGLSIADRAYQAARHWARERIQGTDIGGRGHEPVPIIRHPDVRRMLMDMKSHTEAMRALCYSAAAAVDLARHHPDPMMRARHHGYLELITPVAKAWCTDQGFEMASLGVQVHGGMGYIEEAGAAQYLRDARITMIYEGTNGIQALDLVRRKLRQDGGQAAGRLIADMRATVAALGAERGGALAAIRDRLAPAVDALDQATNWIRDTFADDPVAGAAAATPYCRMMGFTVGGWLLAQGARAAAARLAVANGDTGFHEAKIQTARYFAEQHLPPAAALLGPITHAREIVMAVAEDQL
jgi:alkylation response protein AidB-like acyl-CoA dehydrogenase